MEIYGQEIVFAKTENLFMVVYGAMELDDAALRVPYR